MTRKSKCFNDNYNNYLNVLNCDCGSSTLLCAHRSWCQRSFTETQTSTVGRLAHLSAGGQSGLPYVQRWPEPKHACISLPVFTSRPFITTVIKESYFLICIHVQKGFC